MQTLTSITCLDYTPAHSLSLVAGLDSASSTELLTHLNALAASNRTVVLTIHQPRLEIFHMFHRVMILTDGKVREVLEPVCVQLSELKCWNEPTKKQLSSL